MKNNRTWNPSNYWNNSNWANTPANPFNTFNTNPFTTGLTNWVNNTPAYNTPTTAYNNTPAPAYVNAYETSENYVLELAVPGYSKDSFEVSFTDNSLTVKATTTENNENVNYSYREFNAAPFTRAFSLPTNVDTTETRAKYENGILTVLLTKETSGSNYRTIRVS